MLAQANHVEGHLTAEIERQRRLRSTVFGRPIGVPLAIEHVLRHKSRVRPVAAHVARFQPRAGGEVRRECRIDDAPEFAQRVDVVIMNPAAAVGVALFLASSELMMTGTGTARSSIVSLSLRRKLTLKV